VTHSTFNVQQSVNNLQTFFFLYYIFIFFNYLLSNQRFIRNKSKTLCLGVPSTDHRLRLDLVLWTAFWRRYASWSLLLSSYSLLNLLIHKLLCYMCLYMFIHRLACWPPILVHNILFLLKKRIIYRFSSRPITLYICYVQPHGSGQLHAELTSLSNRHQK